MSKIKTYQDFLILERYDKNIRKELLKLGVQDKNEINKMVHFAKNGYLHAYLNEKGETFTFGMLNAIFKDAINARKITNIKKGIHHILPSTVQLLLIPYFPVLAVIGSIFGASRTFHKVFDPIFDYLNPQSKYTDFLKRMIDVYMKIPEGEIPVKDRFTRAFVVSDRFVEAIKPDILNDFSDYLSEKMSSMPQDQEVPSHYIENELKEYINQKYDIDPKIPLKEAFKYVK